MDDHLNSKHVKIKDVFGYSDFSGVRRKKCFHIIEFVLSDGTTFKCTPEHRIILPEFNFEMQAKEFEVGQFIDSRTIVSKTVKNEETFVYDILNSYSSSYYSDGVLSHNCFHGSGYTLLESAKVFEKIVATRKLYEKHGFKHEEIKIELDHECILKVFKRPEPNRVYFIGADISDGIGIDFFTTIVLDVTDTLHLEVVASCSHNLIGPSEAAAIVNIIGRWYNYSPVFAERIGPGASFLDFLVLICEYDNVIHYGGKHEYGVCSNKLTKPEACLFLRKVFNSKKIKFTIRDLSILKEMQEYEKIDNGGLSRFSAPAGRHDDFIMALIWAVYGLFNKVLPVHCDYVISDDHLRDIQLIDYPSKISPYIKKNGDRIEDILSSSSGIYKSNRQLSVNDDGSKNLEKMYDSFSKLGKNNFSGNDDDTSWMF